MITGIPNSDKKFLAALADGCVGESAAHHFVTFVDYFDKVPTVNDILNNPDTAKAPTERPAIWAVLTSLTGIDITTEHLDETKADLEKRQEHVLSAIITYCRNFVDKEPEIVVRVLDMLYSSWGNMFPGGAQKALLKKENSWLITRFGAWFDKR